METDRGIFIQTYYAAEKVNGSTQPVSYVLIGNKALITAPTTPTRPARSYSIGIKVVSIGLMPYAAEQHSPRSSAQAKTLRKDGISKIANKALRTIRQLTVRRALRRNRE